MTASPDTRLRAMRRHREAFALAVKLGCSLARARAQIIEGRLDQLGAVPRPAPQPQPDASDQPASYWWQRD